MDILDQLNIFLQSVGFFARAGGGGSSDGSSGGGSSVFIIMGYVPMHAVGAAIRRISKKSQLTKVIGSLIGWPIAIVYLVLLNWLAGSLGFFAGIAGCFGMAAGLYGILSLIKQSQQTKDTLSVAGAHDPIWNEERITSFATSLFVRYQTDWSQLNAESIRSYTTPEYYQHTALLMMVLQSMGRRNIVDQVEVKGTIIDAVDSTDNTKDKVVIEFQARSHDKLIDTNDDAVLFTDDATFIEFWQFVRRGDEWLLDDIRQSNRNANLIHDELRLFAEQHGYYYSEDMGWLFIPRRGMLFGRAQFGVSDINNHVVGLYHNTTLVQLYSYIKGKNGSATTTPLVIVQVTVPKQYGHIIVRRNKFIQMPVIGLHRVETEWIQFNKKYEVFASNTEQATSFELLNPAYMEQLDALNFEVSIEVVDNVIYLYTAERTATVEVYTTMLDLIDKAFIELRL